MLMDPLQLAPWQTRDFKLLEKKQNPRPASKSEDEAKDGTFAGCRSDPE